MTEPSTSVAVIATVYNEQKTIARLLDSLARQTHLPDEVVIVDGGSSDGTVKVLQQATVEGSLNLRSFALPGCSISQGRNAAIAAAVSEVIVVTDAGVELSTAWLAELVRPLLEDAGVHVVSGFFVPAFRSLFELVMGATVLPALSDIDPEAFLPSSRSVAFRKSAWQTVGGYPEWLDYCEDLVFDLELKERYGTFAFVPAAVVRFTPRSDLCAFFKQYYRYARGDGKADLWRKRHAIRYLTYLVLAPILVWLAARYSVWWLLAGLAAGLAYTAAPYRRLLPQLRGRPWYEYLYAVLVVPVIRLVGDLAKMVGYPVGWIWRLQHRSEIP